MKEVVRLTAPAAEPLALEDARSHLRVDGDDDDFDIAAMIAAARERAEHYCNRYFAKATFAGWLDEFPAGEIRLPGGTTAITEIKYRDTSDAELTLLSGNYRVNIERRTIVPIDSWPVGTDVRVAFTAGNDAQDPDTEQTPPAVIAAIKLMVGDLYNVREVSVIGASVEMSDTVRHLLNAHRIFLGT